MDATEYLNTISSNSYADWIRCHNDMLHNLTETINYPNKLKDNSIRIISHLLKILLNEKVSIQIKTCILISVEENVEYFIGTIKGAVTFFQSLCTDLNTQLNSKFDHKYLSQMLTVLTTISINYDFPLVEMTQYPLLMDSYVKTLIDLVSKSECNQAVLTLKHQAICSLIELEEIYPTLLLSYENTILNLLNSEKTVMYDLIMQLYSCVFKNSILDNCRTQKENSQSDEPNIPSIDKLNNFSEWLLSDIGKHEKYVGSQAKLFKSLHQIINQSTRSLCTTGVRRVILNCLTIVNRIAQNNPKLWSGFLEKFMRSCNLNIVETLVAMKASDTPILETSELQETLLSIINNTKILIQVRLLASYWLRDYPIPQLPPQNPHLSRTESLCKDDYGMAEVLDESSSNQYPLSVHNNINCLLEPQLVRMLYLRSFDTLEIKYNKLNLLNKFLVISNQSDATSVLMFSSLKDLIKTVQYYDSGISFNILLRIMFSIHVTHFDSVIVRDFENILESLAVKYTQNLYGVIAYLNGLEHRLNSSFRSSRSSINENFQKTEESMNKIRLTPQHKFSSKCMTQIAALSCDTLANSLRPSLSSLTMHLRVLTCAMRLCENITLGKYLQNLLEILISIKLDLNIDWLEKAYEEVLKFIYELIRIFGCTGYYNELTSILFEIQIECKNIRGQFLYALLAYLPSEKVKDVIRDYKYDNISEESFDIIANKLLDKRLDIDLFELRRIEDMKLDNTEKFMLTESYQLEEYLEFISSTKWQPELKCLLKINKTDTDKSGSLLNVLAGILIDFETDTTNCTIDSWRYSLLDIRKDMSVETRLKINISYPQSFRFGARMSATKLDGTFGLYRVNCPSVSIIDLCMPIDIDRSQLSSSDVSDKFVQELIAAKLHQTTFISINFEIKEKYSRFQSVMSPFLFTSKTRSSPDTTYLCLLPPHYQLVLTDTQLSGVLYRRLDLYTDANYDFLVQLEEYFRNSR